MVDLPEPEGPTSAVTVPGCRAEAHVEQHLLARLVGESDVRKIDFAANRARAPPCACGSLILGPLAQHFARALQAGERLGQLRADAHHLHHRRDQERQKRDEGHQVAQRSWVAGEHLARAHDTITTAPTMPISTVAERLISDMAVSDFEHVIQQPLHAAREDFRLALLGVIALHHAHAAQRFGEPPGHLRVDLAALAENRADLGEGLLQT